MTNSKQKPIKNRNSSLGLIAAALFTLMSVGKSANAQTDTFFTNNVSSYDSAGLFYFYPGSVVDGEILGNYVPVLLPDSNNEMILIADWWDSLLNYHHFRYKQHYLGIEVEGAELFEHSHNDETKYVWAKVALMQGFSLNDTLNEEGAFASLSAYKEDWDGYFFPWQDGDWENELKEETGDPDATYFPKGKKLWALDNPLDLGFKIPANRYRLAWTFEVYSLDPFELKTYFVDALTGEVFREDDMVDRDGIIHTPYNGNQTVDTRWNGSLSGHILLSDSGTRNIHTKNNIILLPWNLIAEVKSSNDIWGGRDSLETACHWGATKAWDYFNSIHKRSGMDNNGSMVRVSQGFFSLAQTGYAKKHGFDHIYVSGDFGITTHAELDVIAHEFTHGVSRSTAGFISDGEPASLNESFSDIFGQMIHRMVFGSTDWEHGTQSSGTNPQSRRSLSNPNSNGLHPFDTTCVFDLGMPDTYKGVFWSDFNCNQMGRHTNLGVQNYWFYLLANGGWGTNDKGNWYNIQGIGPDKAAQIAFFNLTNSLGKVSQYGDARANAIAAARAIFGDCSFEHRQTIDAWAAVGLGSNNTCVNSGIASAQLDHKPIIFPNPAEDKLNILLNELRPHNLKLLSVDGKLISNLGTINDHENTIDISGLASGVYLISVSNADINYTIKLVKQ